MQASALLLKQLMRDVRSVRPNVQGKAVTREATREAKLKRGGMKERFGRELCFMEVSQYLHLHSPHLHLHLLLHSLLSDGGLS